MIAKLTFCRNSPLSLAIWHRPAAWANRPLHDHDREPDTSEADVLELAGLGETGGLM